MSSDIEQYLYKKSINCPVCENDIEVTVVKQKGYQVKERDTDFCITYKSINALLYDVWLCPMCGYSALKNYFPTIPIKRGKLIQEFITKKWVAKHFDDVLNYSQSLAKYKLALISAQVSGAKASELANICLKIAWIYRFMEDENKELQFLNYAVGKYEEAFNKEKLPWDTIDEPTAMYLLGELNRRVGNLEQASSWFSKVVSQRLGSTNILNMARDQWHMIKETIKNQKEEV